MPKFITPWRSVAAAFALNGALLGCWASRIPAFVDRLELTESSLGILLLVMGVGALVSFPVAGRLSDRFGAVRVTRWIAIIYLVSIVLVGASLSIFTLAVALFLFGLCHGSMDVAMNSWASEVERHMGRSVMSSFHAMWSLGAALGAAGGYVAASVGTSTMTHYALAAIAIAAIFGPFLLAPWTSTVRSSVQKIPVFALPRGALVLVGLVALGAGLGEGATVDWSAVFLRDVIGTPESQATLGYATFSVTMVLMRLTVDGVISPFGPKLVAQVSGLLAASGYILCATTELFSVTLLAFALMGMGYAAVIPMAFTRAANDPDIPAGQAIASVATLGYGAMLLGPPAIGFIAHVTSLRVSFFVVGLLALMIAAFAASLAQTTDATAASRSPT